MNISTIIAIVLILLGGHIYRGLRSAASWVAARLPSGKMPSLAGIFTAKAELEWWKIAAIVLVVLLSRGVSLPSLPTDWKLPAWPSIIAPAKVTAVTYVFEKDDGGIPSGVTAAIGALNARDIIATTFEDDTVDSSGSVPEQYKVALAESKTQGVPLLVVQAGDKVLRTVKAPTTAAQVLEAAP